MKAFKGINLGFQQVGKGLGVAVFLVTASSGWGAIRTWSGAGVVDATWDDTGNWVGGIFPLEGDSIVFQGDARRNSINDLGGGRKISGITFASTSGSMNVRGNGIFLTGNILNSGTAIQTFGEFSGGGLTIADADRTFNADQGDLVINSNITTEGTNTYLLTTQVAAGKTITLSGTYSGGGGLTKTGAGTTALTGVGLFTGTTTLANGTLSINSAANLQSTAGLVFTAAGSTTTLHATDAIVLNRNIVQNGVGNYSIDAGKTLTLSGTISGAAALNVNGPGTLVLTATNSYIGSTILSSGTLDLRAMSNIQGSSNIVFATGSAATLYASQNGLNITKNILQTGVGNYWVDSGEAVTVSGTISGAGALNVKGPGTIYLSATNSYTGSTILSSGTLDLRAMSNIQASSGIVFATGSAATLYASQNGTDITKNILQNGMGNYWVDSGNTLTVSGTISGAGDLNLRGGGTTVLSATNTYTGSTILSSGTLDLRSVSDIQASSGVVFAIGSSTAALYASQNGINLSKNIVQNGLGNYWVDSGNTLTLSGTISGAGNLNMRGEGKIVLTATNTFTGTTVLSSGTLEVRSTSNLQSSTGIRFNLGSGATLYASQNGINLISNIIQNGAGNYRVDAGNTLTLSGTISGAGDLNLSGGGTAVLTGTNTFTGSTILSSGTLEVRSTGNLQSSAGIVFSTGSAAVLHASQSGIDISRNITQTGVGRYVVDAGSTLTLSGTISGAGDFQTQGEGVTILAGTNTFTGKTVLGSGTLRISSNANLQSSSEIVFSTPSTTNYLHATQDGINITQNIAQTYRANYLVDSGNTLTLSGTISGFGQLQKHGLGTVVLDAENDHTGRTVVNSGTLRLGSGGSIINASNMEILGGVFDVNGKNQLVKDTLIVGSGASSGLIYSSSGDSTFTVHSSILAKSGTIAVNLTGSASFTKSEAGTVLLTGSNNFLGATTVNAGKLLVDGVHGDVAVNGGTLGGSGRVGNVTVESGATIAPGNSAGILTTQDFSLKTGATLALEIYGTTPGAGGYDVLAVNGDVTLAGNISVSLHITPTDGDLFFIIYNNGTQPIFGTFNGLADGDSLFVDDREFIISYFANRSAGTFDGGNDVALMVVPEPSTWGLIGLAASLFAVRGRIFRRRIG